MPDGAATVEARGGEAVRPAPQGDDRDLLRIVICGSVDDGKSTLIGRLLHECRAVADDRMEALAEESRRHGTNRGEIDFALLADGLTAEREQGITIDVAHLYFATERRHFIVADAPGHEQYTRNMATGASRADLALILVDARKGVLTQTRRHAFIAHLLRVPNILLVVNKMDLVRYAQERFETIARDFAAFARGIGIEDVEAVPISALTGDNLAARSERMPWHEGGHLLARLEEAAGASGQLAEAPLRMPVQWVNRAAADFRGYCGLIVSGTVRPGDAVRLLPSGRTSRVERIVAMEGDMDGAVAGQSVTLTFADQVDCARGDLVAAAADPAEAADQFEADLVWMAEAELLPGRSYLMKIGTATVGAAITEIKHELEVDSLERRPARTLGLNAIGLVTLALDRAVPFAPYAENRDLGGFVLIDRYSNATVAAGMIRFALRRASNIHWQPIEVDREAHALLKGQRPRVLWFTGLSGAGKSTIANLVEQRLHAMGRHTFLLDGDNVRHGLNRDLGFTDADRVENIRRAGEVARLMADAGLIVLCAFISPFRAERRMVREMMRSGEFLEIFVDAPLAEAEKRDAKGLYAKARRGELPNFTGIDSPYEPPERPELRIDTTRLSPEQAADLIVDALNG